MVESKPESKGSTKILDIQIEQRADDYFIQAVPKALRYIKIDKTNICLNCSKVGIKSACSISHVFNGLSSCSYSTIPS
jgi:hypothetical protein